MADELKRRQADAKGQAVRQTLVETAKSFIARVYKAAGSGPPAAPVVSVVRSSVGRGPWMAAAVSPVPSHGTN